MNLRRTTTPPRRLAAPWRITALALACAFLVAAAPAPARTTATLPLLEIGRFQVGMPEARAIALMPVEDETRILIGGAEGVDVHRLDGRRLRRIALPRPVTSLAFAGESRRIFAASKTRIYLLSPEGELLDQWGEEGKEAGRLRYVTSIAAAEPVVFIADASNRRVSRFAVNGDYVDAIEGFLVPSPYFDCAVDAKGNLHVVDPARHEVVRYDRNMRRVDAWGQFGQATEDFCGCCNPTAIALLPGGAVATTEKGTPRLKVYDARGRMIACEGPDRFPRRSQGMDLAASADGRIILLEPLEKTVRIYRAPERDAAS